MKKTICLLLALLLLTACQPTPDTPPVVYRGEGLPADAIIDPAPAGTVKAIDAPAHWTQTMERNDGHIVIEADVDVEVPQTSNTPIIEVVRWELTDEEVTGIQDYLTAQWAYSEEPGFKCYDYEDDIKPGYLSFGAQNCTDRADLARSEAYVRDYESVDNGLAVVKEMWDMEKAFLTEGTKNMELAWSGEANVTHEHAIEAAQRLMADMNMDDLTVRQVSEGYVELTDGTLLPCYGVDLTRDVGGIAAIDPTGSFVVHDLPGLSYAPQFAVELLKVYVTADCIVRVDWANMARYAADVASNTALLPFSEITGRLADYVYYAYAQDDGSEPLFDSRFVVKSAALRSSYIPAYDSPDNVWLVPVWEFVCAEYRTSDGSERLFNPDYRWMVNAIDGGYVEVRNL